MERYVWATQPSPYSWNLCLGSHVNLFIRIQTVPPPGKKKVQFCMDPGERTVIYFVCNNIGWFAFKEQKLKWKERDRDREWEFHILSTGPAKKKKKKKKKPWHLALVFPTSFFKPFSMLSKAPHCLTFFSKGTQTKLFPTPHPLFSKWSFPRHIWFPLRH